MKRFTKSENINLNYCASIIKVDNLFKHPNPEVERLQCLKHNFLNIITGLDTKEGDVVIYFPIECQISEWFLHENNLYQEVQFNKDSSQKGMFNNKGRVKCIRLKGCPSEGFIIPLKTLIPDENVENLVGVTFDTFENKLLVNKYVVKQDIKTSTNTSSNKSKKIGNNVKDIMIENQFRFHQETPKLNDNIFILDLDDIIQTSYKVHGSSGIVSNVLIQKKLTWKDKIASWFIDIPTKEYGYIYSSGKPKSKTPKGIEGRSFESTGSFYGNDNIWQSTFKQLKPFLTHGLTIYYEIVGFSEDGGIIQKDYDYGCEPKESNIFIYRITQTNDQGIMYEFSAKQVQDWCKMNGLTPVHEFYYGNVQNLLIYLYEKYEGKKKFDEDWKSKLYEFLQKEYLEKDCFMCKNKVPEEGIVLRIERPYLEVYKLKSFKFNERETKQLDKGVIDIESQENDV